MQVTSQCVPSSKSTWYNWNETSQSNSGKPLATTGFILNFIYKLTIIHRNYFASSGLSTIRDVQNSSSGAPCERSLPRHVLPPNCNVRIIAFLLWSRGLSPHNTYLCERRKRTIIAHVSVRLTSRLLHIRHCASEIWFLEPISPITSFKGCWWNYKHMGLVNFISEWRGLSQPPWDRCFKWRRAVHVG